mgnify:CR=1 FL=1
MKEVKLYTDGVLVIENDIVDKPSGLSLYTNGASSMNIESNIRSQIESTIEQERLKKYDIENLDEIMNEIKANVSMQTYRNDEENKASSSELSYIIGLLMDMLLYFFLMLYGQMVMTSIIEEKNNLAKFNIVLTVLSIADVIVLTPFVSDDKTEKPNLWKFITNPPELKPSISPENNKRKVKTNSAVLKRKKKRLAILNIYKTYEFKLS